MPATQVQKHKDLGVNKVKTNRRSPEKSGLFLNCHEKMEKMEDEIKELKESIESLVQSLSNAKNMAIKRFYS